MTCSVILAGAIATCVMSASAQVPPPFDHIVVFGDSLSDTGNAGRFSNGPVWVEQLAARLEVALRPTRAGGLNFAVGGARLDPLSGPHSLRAQADLFLGMRQPSGRTLHIVFGGGNDLLSAVGRLKAPRMVETAVASLRSIVADLVRHGASDLLVPNLPDVGMTPMVRARGNTAVAHAGWLTQQFNGAADRALSELAGAFGSVRLHRLDVRAMAARARTHPAAFGFVDIKNPCIRLPGCEGYLFWDHVHPTTQAHGRLADAALATLSLPVSR
jgi:phospholipase/lecithinase/hemolysin